MSGLIKRDETYTSWVSELKERYQRSQIRASVAVNTQMLMFYWSLGRDIVGMQAENRYGAGFYDVLSNDLRRVLPDAKGFSSRNLRYMTRYYEFFPAGHENLPQDADEFRVGDSENLPQLAADSPTTTATSDASIFNIPWGHVRLLIDKCGDSQGKALFYIRKTIENNWSRAVLSHQIEADLYGRQGRAVRNFAATSRS